MNKLVCMLCGIFFLLDVCHAQQNHREYKDFIGMRVYYPYMENGLWGMKSAEEIIMKASYDSLKCGYCGVFPYKNSGKWGLMSFYNKITNPMYDDLDIVNSRKYNTAYGYCKNDELNGVMTLLGDIIIPIKYKYISHPYEFTYDKGGVYSMNVFLVQNDSGYNIINESDDLIAIGVNDTSIINYFKNKHWEFYRYKKTEKKIIKLMKAGCNSLRKSIGNDSFKMHVDNKAYSASKGPKELRIPRKTYINEGYRWSTHFNDSLPYNYIIYKGEKTKMNSIGVIEITLNATSEDRLRRDPLNIIELRKIVDDNRPPVRGYRFYLTNEEMLEDGHARDEENLIYYMYIKSNYEKLLQLCIKKGCQDSPLYDSMKEKYDYAISQIPEYEKSINQYNKRKEFEARVDGIANSVLRTLNTFAKSKTNIDYGVTNKHSENDIVVISDGEPSISKSPSNKFSISEQNNYNTDKRTWGNYDSMLASHFAGNKPATKNDVVKWQQAMKKLRSKWTSKGKSFPQSANENKSTSSCANGSHSH